MMRASVVLLLALCACTRPNPNRCCSDESDCNAKGIPVGSVCEQGLVCRGNQCIAQPCTSSAECDAAAPYCMADLCSEQCSEDAQCPGAGESAQEQFCIEGDCVTCRASTDCSSSAPVCDAGTCRLCEEDSECASLVCDAGHCIEQTKIAYASPTGSGTAGCTTSEPCTLERAIAVSDATRSTIKLMPGSYMPPSSGEWQFKSDFELTIFGPATLTGSILVAIPYNAKSFVPRLKLRRLSVTGHLACSGDGAAAAVPSLELDHVVIDAPVIPLVELNALYVSRCKLTVRDSIIRAQDPYAAPLFITGGGGAGGQPAIIERSFISIAENPNGLAGDPIIMIEAFASIHVTNSVLRGGGILSQSNGAIAFGTNFSDSSITFSTFYNTALRCPENMLGKGLLESQNNIFLNERAGGPADLLTGTACRHRYVLAKPQAAPINGSNNMSNLDPRFVNPAADDFHLTVGSPAIDNADPAATQAVDFDGAARPQGDARDIGAFEYK